MVCPLNSMTGFGRGSADLGGLELAIEVRSGNSRHLDLRLRLPRELQALESGLRELASGYFSRGQVEIVLRLPVGLASPALEIDLEAATRYAHAAAKLCDELDLGGPLSVSTLIGLPGVARLREPPLDPDALRGALRSALEQACAAARQMRAREGEALAAELRGRLDRLDGLVGEIEAVASGVPLEFCGMRHQSLFG